MRGQKPPTLLHVYELTTQKCWELIQFHYIWQTLIVHHSQSTACQNLDSRTRSSSVHVAVECYLKFKGYLKWVVFFPNKTQAKAY